ncbi:hypothetical protein DRP04_06185 [Archaeoglobales archaeon]|nr:MAG: hypothetical protein DRP04_06185 [Archaeoglobales archaeon]
MRRLAVFFILITVTALIVAALIAGCIEEKSKTGYVEIKDMAGRTVKIPEKVERIATLFPANLRIIVMLNATDKVVGISNYFDKYGDKLEDALAHPELLKAERIGSVGEPDMEKIAELRPDVIFIESAYAQIADTIEKNTGVPVVCINTSIYSGKLDDFYKTIRLVARIIGKEKRAEKIIEYIDSEVENVTKRVKDIPKEETKVFLSNWAYRHGISWTVKYYAPINLIARNVAENIPTHYMEVTKEQIIEWNPDVIFIHGYKGKSAVDEILNDPALQHVKAVKEGKVYGLFGPYIGYDPKTMIVDLYWAAKVIYPERFKDVDVMKKGEEVFTFFYGKKGAEVFHEVIENRGLYLSQELTPQ